jgi:hypothetical protein
MRNLARMRVMALVTTLSAGGGAAWAQPAHVPPEGPAVSMSVTTPAGQARELTTHESGLATLDVNGHQYGFRPTMYDDDGNRMTVTIFDLGGPGQPVREIGAVDVTGGGAAVASRSTPAFKVKAWKSVQPAGAQTTR